MSALTTEFLHRPDGARVAMHVGESPRDDAPLFLLLPAMGIGGGYYRRFGEQLHDAGLWPVFLDHRGQGESEPKVARGISFGYWDMVDDVEAALTQLSDRSAGRRVILGGHSLGGQTAMLHQSDPASHHRVDAFVLMGAGLPYWRAYRGSGRGILVFTQLVGLISTVLGVWPGWRFGGTQPRRLMREWAYVGRTGRYPGRHGGHAELSVLDLPTLAVTFEHDTYAPPDTQRHLAEVMPHADVTGYRYTAAAAGGRVNHFAWAKASGVLAREISAWVARLG